MKKLTLLSSLALATAASPLLGQTILFQDDFSTSTATGNPDNAIWGSNVRNETANKTIKVTSANAIFGEGNNYLHHRHVAGESGSLFIEANGQFATPSEVITFSFDFYMPSTTSWGTPNTYADPRFRFGISGAFASNNSRLSNEIRFYGDTESASALGFSGTGGIFSQDTIHSTFVVLNNSASTITYGENDSLSVESGQYDVWLDGSRVIAGAGSPGAASGTNTGTPDAITTIGFGSFAGGSELFLDNLVVYEGAHVIPEPSTYALGAGILALGGAWMWRRRRAA